MTAPARDLLGYAYAIDDLIAQMDVVRHNLAGGLDQSRFGDHEAGDVIDMIEQWKRRLNEFQGWLMETTGFEWEDEPDQP